MSPDHLVEYWSALDRQTVHPDDRATLSQLPHGQFAVDLQPLPWNGPLRSARVYILFLNPGLKPTDHEWERLPEVRKALRLNLKGDSPYLYLQSEFINRPGNEWTRRHFGRDIGDAQADKICVVQLVAYHSENNKGDKVNGAARDLPSSRESLRFVHDWLVPHAKAGKIGLIVVRAAKQWKLSPADNCQSIIVYDSRKAEPLRADLTANSDGGKLLRRLISN